MPNLNFFKKPDDRLLIGDREYGIDMRLDTVIRFIYLLEDKTVSPTFKISQGLKLMIDDDLSDLPLDIRAMVLGELKNYISDSRSQVVYDRAGNALPMPVEEEVTDFEEDFDYIYSAFIQVYGIDLIEERGMDYRKFKALLISLPKNTHYREILEIRTLDEREFDKKTQPKIRKAKQRVKLKKGGNS